MANKWYSFITVDGKKRYAHRVVWESAHGPIPDGMQIDHINGIKNDNRLENLRCVTVQQNQYNRADVKGFTWDKWSGKWKAQITHNYKNIFLGRYTNLIDARAAYLRKYNEINGENFNGRI